MYGFILGLLILDSAVLMVVVLLQAGQGGGLAALGGSGGTESFFGGRHAVTWLTKTTWAAGGAFLFLSLVLSFMSASSSIGTTHRCAGAAADPGWSGSDSPTAARDRAIGACGPGAWRRSPARWRCS